MIKTIVGLFFISFLSLSAQNNINFEFDYARYAYSSDSSFIEFYYSFEQNNLSIIKTDSAFAVHAILKIQILKNDSTGKNYVINNSWRIDSKIADSSEMALNKNLIGTIGLIIPAGEYICMVTGTDEVDTTRTKTISEKLSVASLVGKNITLSDIELASNIQQDNVSKTSVFYKNTLEVIPNPTMVFGQGFPVLFYYLEVYNLNNTESNNPLFIKTMLFNSKGVKLVDKTKPIIRSSNSRVEVGTLNLTKYTTDTYTLAISMFDSISNTGISSTKRFYIYNPSVKDTQSYAASGGNVLSSEFGALSSEECDLMYEKLKYIISDSEDDQYSALETVESKREFLYNFWKKRDPDASTPVNEYYNEYMKRVNESNERYGTLNRKGMKTDRGRILIIYGEPDEIDRYPNDIDKKPYEVWQYNQIEGGVVFIFGDVSGFSNYELLHSTKRGELRDDNWQRRIQTN